MSISNRLYILEYYRQNSGSDSGVLGYFGYEQGDSCDNSEFGTLKVHGMTVGNGDIKRWDGCGNDDGEKIVLQKVTLKDGDPFITIW